MNPRRLHKLTIFSIRCTSGDLLIETDLIADYADVADNTGARIGSAKKGTEFLVPSCFPVFLIDFLRYPRDPRLRLRLDCDFRLYGIGDETLLVRHAIHLLDLFRRGLVITGEFEVRP